MSAEKYVTHWDMSTNPHWVTRLENGQYQSYHYVKEAADLNTAHLNELVKLRAAYAEMAAKIMSLRASERALQSENAALRHSEENLAATVRGLEFELEKVEKATAMLRGTVEALGDANDRLTIEISGLRKDKERLSWLAVSDVWFDYPATESFTPETFRAAIDAYMAKESSNCQGIHDSSNGGAT
jgi:predicted nuclease with TOPRIM domain